MILCIDAGIETIRCFEVDTKGYCVDRSSFPGNSVATRLKESYGAFDGSVLVTGKLQKAIKSHFPEAHCFSTQAVLWSAASRQAEETGGAVAVISLSASGYHLVGVDSRGQLKNDLLITNPRCGAGSGINLDRVLSKLSIDRNQVDILLKDYLGEEGKAERNAVPVRTDRCGVFASSATISDKNQGIPLSFALATTLKSEVLKVCAQIRGGFDRIILTGGVFRWRFARDCAADSLSATCVAIEHDASDLFLCRGLWRLGQQLPVPLAISKDCAVEAATTSSNYPGFAELHQRLSGQHLYHRETVSENEIIQTSEFNGCPVLIAIDVGSTMAKVIVAPCDKPGRYYRRSYSNAGDTIQTVQAVFRDLYHQGLEEAQVEQVGITGSARYQVGRTLKAVYPDLTERIEILVENYAHARGSIAVARRYLKELEQAGVENLNEKFCFLVDVGGEDTKISSIDLEQGDLYDNAMNTKCSAGTGSLFDTLIDLFDLDDIDEAVREAMLASRAFSLNATCAVFLLESARRLQAEGVPRNEILASAVWAIVENMARSLWSQIRISGNSVVLLHGLTMQSDPLPLAICERLQLYLGAPAYCLVPDSPGFRGCLGLIQTMTARRKEGFASIALKGFVEQSFSRRIIQCRGAVCGDKGARCYRSKLSSYGAVDESFSVTLGGCAAINDAPDTREKQGSVRDSCRDIWNYRMSLLPTSIAENRLIIPRVFAASEWARFFASLFEPCGIPVHVDLPVEADILNGQPHFRIDTCAPHVGAVGQMLRLADTPHGMILAPQIEFLPGKGKALGRTCTINQGGFATAVAVARDRFPASRFAMFHLDLKAGWNMLAHRLYQHLLPVYRHYHVDIDFDEFEELVRSAINDQRHFQRESAGFAADLAREALRQGQQIAIVVGREYVFNPGVYDSHVGRLLRDKGLVGIPSYVLAADVGDRHSHIYWRNAQLITGIIDAATRKRLAEIVTHTGLKQVIATYEQRIEVLPVVQVSTFLCGPDSVIQPLINTLVTDRPFLRIHSDAAIKELAHLENRMNTYVRQLAATGSQRVDLDGDDPFDVELLSSFENRQGLNAEKDLICFPTLSDNRPLLAVLKSAGFDCLENYDENYNLEALIERGRSVTGDSVCAPLSAVYGDILNAVERFSALRESDPQLRNKERLLIFNNKGLGPCRQGQYVEAHKLFLLQHGRSGSEDQGREDVDRFVQFLVAHENEGFKTGFPGWVYLRGIQAAILQGVLHQLRAEGVARCRDQRDYLDFLDAYNELTRKLLEQIEAHSRPGRLAARLLEMIRPVPGLFHIAAFWGWGFHRRHLTMTLASFRQRWCRRPLPQGLVKIHIDGEAYMRTAQFEGLQRALTTLLGAGNFQLTYTPLWGFLEYKLAGMIMRAKEGIVQSRAEIARSNNPEFIKKRRRFLRKKQKRYVAVAITHFVLRKVLATPLYRAAGVPMPESLRTVLEVAKQVVPTRRPGGELIPYIGEAVIKLGKGYDLVLNVAPEGCMVSSMGEVITPAIYKACPGAKGKIQPFFSQQGDIDYEKLEQALLQALGPDRVYRLRHEKAGG